ncbi:GntR family transcriptional regulator [Ralstonia pseudosolanacearum]
MNTKANEPLAPLIASRLVQVLKDRKIEVGSHLPERIFCEALEVSRTPVRRAFELLAKQGILTNEPGRGYFLLQAPAELVGNEAEPSSNVDELYLQLAEDLLVGTVGSEFSERALLMRYGAGRGLLKQVLARMFREGLLERKTGRGWRVTPFLSNADAHNASYRFRMAIEPAAILEPTFRLDKPALAKARAKQEAMLAGEIFTLTRAELFEIGSQFHETIIRCSRNPNFIDALVRQNQQRRLIEYKANTDRQRLIQQCEEHLKLLDLLEHGQREEAAAFLRQHLNVARKIKTHVEDEDPSLPLPELEIETHF